MKEKIPKWMIRITAIIRFLTMEEAEAYLRQK